MRISLLLQFFLMLNILTEDNFDWRRETKMENIARDPNYVFKTFFLTRIVHFFHNSNVRDKDFIISLIPPHITMPI